MQFSIKVNDFIHRINIFKSIKQFEREKKKKTKGNKSNKNLLRCVLSNEGKKENSDK